MADSQVCHDISKCLELRMIVVIQDLFHLLFILENKTMGVCCEINWLVVSSIGIILFGHHTESSCFGAELFELHDIASECASLVREDVLDLAELLIDVGALGFTSEVLFVVEHFHIILHEGTLEELYHFKRNKQRNGHKIAVKRVKKVNDHCCVNGQLTKR